MIPLDIFSVSIADTFIQSTNGAYSKYSSNSISVVSAESSQSWSQGRMEAVPRRKGFPLFRGMSHVVSALCHIHRKAKSNFLFDGGD